MGNRVVEIGRRGRERERGAFSRPGMDGDESWRAFCAVKGDSLGLLMDCHRDHGWVVLMLIVPEAKSGQPKVRSSLTFRTKVIADMCTVDIWAGTALMPLFYDDVRLHSVAMGQSRDYAMQFSLLLA